MESRILGGIVMDNVEANNNQFISPFKKQQPVDNCILYVKRNGRCIFIGKTDINGDQNKIDDFIDNHYSEENVFMWYAGKEFCIHEY